MRRCRASTLIARIAEEMNLEATPYFFQKRTTSLTWFEHPNRQEPCLPLQRLFLWKVEIRSKGGVSTVKGTWTVGIRIFWNSDLIHWPGLGRDHRNLAVRCATARRWQLINIKLSLYLFHSYYLLRRYEGTKVRRYQQHINIRYSGLQATVKPPRGKFSDLSARLRKFSDNSSFLS